MPKLTPEQREEMLAKIAAGATYEEAGRWVKATFGVSMTKQAISKTVAKHRSERAEVSKAIARDHIARQLPKDLKACDEKHVHAARLLDLAARDAEGDPSTANFEKYSKAAQVYLKFEELKRKTVGLEQPDEVVADLASLLAKA